MDAEQIAFVVWLSFVAFIVGKIAVHELSPYKTNNDKRYAGKETDK